MRILTVILIAAILSASPLLGQVTQEIIIGPDIDMSGIDLSVWEEARLEWLVQNGNEYMPESFRISTGTPSGAFCGRIQIFSGWRPRNKLDPDDTFYHWLTHELSHVNLPCNVLRRDSATDEGLASAQRSLVYQELNKRSPNTYSPSTNIFYLDIVNNMPLYAVGGANTFYQNYGRNYQSAAGQYELLADSFGGNFKKFLRSIWEQRPQSRSAILAIADSLSPGINGVKASTILGYTLPAFLNGPDGIFFGATLWTFQRGMWKSYTAVNPTSVNLNFISRLDGNVTILDGWMKYQVTDVFGVRKL